MKNALFFFSFFGGVLYVVWSCGGNGCRILLNCVIYHAAGLLHPTLLAGLLSVTFGEDFNQLSFYSVCGAAGNVRSWLAPLPTMI